MEDRIKKLEEKLLILETEKKTTLKWLGIVVLIILGWLGFTSIYQVPKAADNWLKDKGLSSLQKSIEDLKRHLRMA